MNRVSIKTETITVYQDRVVVKEVEKIVEKVVYKDRVKTQVVTKPDGTRIETKEETKVSTASTDKVVEEIKTNERTEIKSDRRQSSGDLSRYSLSILYPIHSLNFQRDFYMAVGARLGNLPIFVEAIGQPLRQQLGIGVRYEF